MLIVCTISGCPLYRAVGTPSFLIVVLLHYRLFVLSGCAGAAVAFTVTPLACMRRIGVNVVLCKHSMPDTSQYNITSIDVTSAMVKANDLLNMCVPQIG
jgi:hypothetical protein